MRERGLPGFTTGSGCLAPALCSDLFEACARQDFGRALAVRESFIPLEDQRDAWGPARVLHAALEACDVARTGPIPPFVTALSDAQRAELAPVARELHRRESERRG
jgi:dihydrodipicolinate synthase/N-acetylneuraminate lyase